jgi:hypothetical protein
LSSNQAIIVARMGASGSGKSLDVKNKLRESHPTRLLIWDTMNEYADFAQRADTLSKMVEGMKSSATFRLRYVPERVDPKKLAERFDVFCAVAYAAGDLVMVVEELQTVTSPSFAGASWSDCTLRGRHKGLTIIGVSQRPASVDKNFFSNCTLVITGRLNYVEDIRCMANVLGVPEEAIGEMPQLAFIQRNMTTGETHAGDVPLPGHAPKALGAVRELQAQPARVDQVAQPGVTAANDVTPTLRAAVLPKRPRTRRTKK